MATAFCFYVPWYSYQVLHHRLLTSSLKDALARMDWWWEVGPLPVWVSQTWRISSSECWEKFEALPIKAALLWWGRVSWDLAPGNHASFPKETPSNVLDEIVVNPEVVALLSVLWSDTSVSKKSLKQQRFYEFASSRLVCYECPFETVSNFRVESQWLSDKAQGSEKAKEIPSNGTFLQNSDDPDGSDRS